MLEIEGVASSETVLVAPNLPGSFILGDYLLSHRCLVDYFNAQFLTRADARVGTEQDITQISRPSEDARSQRNISRSSDLSSSTSRSEVADTQQKQNFTLFATETIKV